MERDPRWAQLERFAFVGRVRDVYVTLLESFEAYCLELKRFNEVDGDVSSGRDGLVHFLRDRLAELEVLLVSASLAAATDGAVDMVGDVVPTETSRGRTVFNLLEDAELFYRKVDSILKEELMVASDTGDKAVIREVGAQITNLLEPLSAFLPVLQAICYDEGEISLTSKVVIHFDMVAYSSIALELEKKRKERREPGTFDVFLLNALISDTVDCAVAYSLKQNGRRIESLDQVVVDMAGDGGLVYLDSMDELLDFVDALEFPDHVFGDEADEEGESYDDMLLAWVAEFTGEERPRWRIGAAVGEVGFQRRHPIGHLPIRVRTGGLPIIDACRIANDCKPGELILTIPAFEALPGDAKDAFADREAVKAKGHENREIEVKVRERRIHYNSD